MNFKLIDRLGRTSLLILVCTLSASVSQAAVDNGTLTVGRITIPAGCGPSWPPGMFDLHLSGYSGFGSSYSPTGLTGGQSVQWIYDQDCGGNFDRAELWISGFTSDPGSTWLNSITCNGATKTAATASYWYLGNTAQWVWLTPFYFFLEPAGTIDSCSIDHI